MKKTLLFLCVSLILLGYNGIAQTALEFDGVDDYVQTTFPGIFENNPRTIQAWIYLTEAPTADMCILDFGYNAEGMRNTFMVNEDGYLQFDMGGDMLIGTFGGTLPINEWVHVAFVYDGGEGYLYVNGGKTDNGDLEMLTPEDETPLRIGESVLGGMPFKGMIDEVNIWDTGMEDEIAECFEDPLPSEVVAFYNFDDGTGSTLTDLVGGNNGTLINMEESDWVTSPVCLTTTDVSFVVTGDDGVTPIENAEVDLDGVVQYTDANGETTFDKPAGTYDYTVSKGGYFNETGTVEVVDEDVVVEVSMTLNGVTGDITFSVSDELSGDPVENALVDLDGVQQYTDASGETVFTGYLPETYNYSISKDEYYTQSGSVEVIDTDITEIVVLAPYVYYDITFAVTEDDGTTPIENAEVTLGGVQQLTDASGETVFTEYLPGTYNYSITKDEYYAQNGSVVVIDDDVTEDVMLDPYIYYNITFVVTDEISMLPVENALVNLDGVEQLTDASGETVFAGYLPDTYDYSITAGEYYEQSGSVVVVDTDVFEDVVLAPYIYYEVVFVVTEDDGTTPVENAEVDLGGVIQYTDASGIAFFMNLPDTYSYAIKLDGYMPAFGEVEVVDANVLLNESLIAAVPGALEFGGGGYVQTTYPGVLGSAPRTFMAWIYRQAGLTATKTILDYGRNTGYDRNTFMVNGSGYLSYLSGGTNSGITASEASVPEEVWVHVAFVWDGDSAFLYQDGVKVGSKAITGPTTINGYTDLRIGRRVGGTNLWKGMMDDVSIWDVALTQQEVIDYACISDPYTYENLAAYYTFNDGTGMTLTDLVAGNNGTLIDYGTGLPVWVDHDDCTAATYDISFVVTEDDGTTPVENAQVDLDGETLYTGANGEVVFGGWESGTYEYAVSKDGYFSRLGSVDVVNANVSVEVVLQSEWQANPTDIVHTIQVPLAANPNIFGEELVAGDWIGVFFIDEEGMEVCGGTNQISPFGSTVVTAYGDDITTGEKDGFEEGELFRWKMFDVSEGAEYYATATYDETAPNQEFFAALGLSALTSLEAVEYMQQFIFEPGWNSMSTYLTPENADVEAMVAPFVNNLTIIRNLSQVYWPEGNINTIGDYDNQSGYVLHVDETVNYQLLGSGLAGNELNLENPGWHFMPILSECPVTIEDLFGDQIENVVIVMELLGVNVYWPEMSINTLTELEPGKAYSIKISDEVLCEFPACNFKSGWQDADRANSMVTPWGTLNFSPNKQTTVFLSAALNEMQTGDVIGAFNTNGDLCGAATLGDLSANNVISLFGNDEATGSEDGFAEGEAVTYKLYRPATGEQYELDVNYNQVLDNTSGAYYQHSFAAVGKASLKATGLVDNSTQNIQLFPNPAQDVVSIRVSGSESGLVKVQVVDINGRTVIEQEFEGQTTLNVNALEAGIYSVKIFTNNEFNSVKKLIIR